MKKIDLTGLKFGRLTVLYEDSSKKGKESRYVCLCSCGIVKSILSSSLRKNKQISCGCQRSNRLINHGEFINHNKKGSPEYSVWRGIRRRCYNKNYKFYCNYGGRNIKVCDQWLDKKTGFGNFLADMGRRPSSKHSLDRIKNDGNYEPSNCRWATREEQHNNTRRNIIIEHNGEKKSVSQWARFYNIHKATLLNRLLKGYSITDALTSEPNKLPKNGRKKYTFS